MSGTTSWSEQDGEWPQKAEILDVSGIGNILVQAVTIATRRAIAQEIRAVAENPESKRPLRNDAEFPNDLANDMEWAAMIAENYEP